MPAYLVLWCDQNLILCLLNTHLKDFLFFQYVLISLLVELCFAYFWTLYFFSLLPCIPSNKLSFSVLWLQLLFHYYLSFYSDPSLIVLIGWLLQITSVACHCLFIERNSWNIVYFIKMSTIFMTVVSVSELTGPILVTDAKTWIRFYNVNYQV